MKKRTGILLCFLALSLNAENLERMVNEPAEYSETSDRMDQASHDRIGRLVAAGLIMGGSELAGRKLGTAGSIVKGSQLSSALYALGTVARDSTYKDLALRVPLALGTAKMVGLPQVQEALNKIPLGIGAALEKMGSDASSVEALAAYEMLKPLYTQFRDDTKPGQWLVHGN